MTWPSNIIWLLLKLTIVLCCDSAHIDICITEPCDEGGVGLCVFLCRSLVLSPQCTECIVGSASQQGFAWNNEILLLHFPHYKVLISRGLSVILINMKREERRKRKTKDSNVILIGFIPALVSLTTHEAPWDHSLLMKHPGITHYS
jgi:hypothetical protein